MPFTHPRDFEALHTGAQPEEKVRPTLPARRISGFVKGLIAGTALAAGAAVALPAIFIKHTPAPPNKLELAKQTQQSPPRRDVTPRSPVGAADPARNAPPPPDAAKPPELVTAPPPPPPTNEAPRSAETSVAVTEPAPPRDNKADLLGGPEPSPSNEKPAQQAKAPAEEIKAPVVARTEQPETRPVKKPEERRASKDRRSGEARRHTERRRPSEERRYSEPRRGSDEPRYSEREREVVVEERPRMGGLPFGLDRLFSGGRDRDDDRRSVLRDHPGFSMGSRRSGPFDDD